MPTYEYACNKCGHQYEKFQKMSDEPEKVCPECGSSVRKLISRCSGIITKHGGHDNFGCNMPCGGDTSSCDGSMPCNQACCKR